MTINRRIVLSLMAQAIGAAGADVLAGERRVVPSDGIFQITQAEPRWRLAFGSCAKQTEPQEIWKSIEQTDPHLFVFLGDNFYADARTESLLRQRHEEFRAHPAVSAFRSRHRHVAIWDDHDYGDDDVGAEYPHRAISQALFCDTWNEPATSPRRSRQGVYAAYLIEGAGRTVQVILPDLRFNRSALTADESARKGYASLMAAAARGEPAPGWYRPTSSSTATLLGEEQWAWLESRLKVPADLHIVASSIQFAAEGTGWECWSHFPHERRRLVSLIEQHRVGGVLFISGDMHYGEASCLSRGVPYPLWDITSSGLTETWTIPTPNGNRRLGPWTQRNFGMLEIDWATQRVVASIRDEKGLPQLSQVIHLRDLRIP